LGDTPDGKFEELVRPGIWTGPVALIEEIDRGVQNRAASPARSFFHENLKTNRMEKGAARLERF
jgi:hypothetical protein